MREILFRGKRTDNGEWIEGKGVDLCFDIPCILTEKRDLATMQSHVEETFVIPETVGQYTGLTDKNGVKMYEGDIVKGLFKYSQPVNSVVEFRDGSFGLRWFWGDIEMFWAFPSICNVEYEVIGNIHDNPELMEAK